MIEMKPSFASGVDPRISAAELVAMVSGSHKNPRCTLYTTDIQRSKKWTEKRVNRYNCKETSIIIKLVHKFSQYKS